MGSFGIGASVRRKEDLRFLTGKGKYTDDINRPGQLQACLLRSPHAHAEIAGFLAKIDEYTNATPAVKSNAASASLKLDLGINGMAVDATIEQPNRGGILVVGVNRGSVAQKSGLIVGDILYEFDGHPIKTLVDLEAAVAGCAPNSLAAIRLYRGTNEMVLTAHF